MTRGGRSSWRIVAHACVLAAVVVVAAPATAGAQSGVDEYTLDIPGAGSSSGGSGDSPSAGAAGSGDGGDSTGGGAGGGGGADGGEEGGRGGGAGSDGYEPFHDRAGGQLGGDSRSAPEVVADTLFDSAMLPVLGALLVITGVGAWRLVRHRRALSGAAG